ncbi:hypothetical protein J6590_093104 [Homalodisca vitripennis]|nr:hypothetical protein J6590_093104 [Homalodisca vitripennis]
MRAPFCRWIVELRTNSPTMLSTMIYCERVKLRPKLTTITLITWFVAQVDNSSFGRRCGHQKFGLPNESQILHSVTRTILMTESELSNISTPYLKSPTVRSALKH